MTKKLKTNIHTFVVLAYQESPFLDSCLKSVISNKESNVLIATTTPNNHIKQLANKYHIDIIIGQHTNIGGDFDFAFNAAKTPLVTIAHQDDIYEKEYAKNIIDSYDKKPNSSIIFTDYYEIRNSKKVLTNHNLAIKRFLLIPLRISGGKAKRSALRFGCAISCPTVTFVKNNCPTKIFSSNFKCNVDWHAWEKLSRKKNTFTFIAKPLMGHRISESSTTTSIINEGIRTKEDYQIFQRFWPRPIAKFLAKIYRKSEKSNQLNTA